MTYLNYDGLIYFWNKLKNYISENISNIKNIIDNYTINGYKISENPVLNKSDIGLGNVDNVSSKDAPISDAVQAALDLKVDKITTINGHQLTQNITITKADISLENVTNDAQVKRSEMGIANGVATLDSAGLVPSSQLPSYVDDVLEYESKSAFPSSGETGKIYVDKSTNYSYRWTGSSYCWIGNPFDGVAITNEEIDEICNS